MEPMSVRDLHHRAMGLADLADIERRSPGGTNATARALLRAAAILEERAAEMIDALDQPVAEKEPTRGILYRSAAWLHHNYGNRERAALLALRGLEGAPPPEIAAELREVLTACQESSAEAATFAVRPFRIDDR